MARLAWLDNLRGLGILFIVLGHVFGAGCHLSTGTAQEFCDAAYKYFYAFHVPLFFVVAGMTFKRQEWGRFFKNKFFRLIVPYLVFGVAGAVIYSLMYSTSTQVLNASATTTYYQGKTVDISFCDQLVNLALGGWHELGFVGNSVLWFIPALFSVELVAQVVVRLADWCGRRRTVWVGVMVLALGVYASRVGLPKLPWALGMVPKYLPYFILGSFMGLRGIPGGKRILVPVAIVAVVVFGWLAVINPYQWHERAVWQFGISIALAVANIVAWQVVAQLVSFKALAACGVASMGIMLMHKYPMLLVQNYFAPVRGLFGGGTLSMFFGVAVVFVCAVVMCLVGCKVLGRWLPWVLGEKR